MTEPFSNPEPETRNPKLFFNRPPAPGTRSMKFIKFHGYGNDYLVFAGRELRGVADLGAFARRVCDRHFGAGADGIAVVDPDALDAGDGASDAGDRADDAAGGASDAAGGAGVSDGGAGGAGGVGAGGAGGVGAADVGAADFRVRIFNPDGSEAAMSGNGTRCAASSLFYEGVWSGPELRLRTLAGVKVYRLVEADGARGRYRFAAEIGRPRFESGAVPILTDEPLARVSDHPLEVAPGETVRVTALEMCNPNCCLFVDDLERADWRRLGPLIESHPRFPARTNVEFVRVHTPERIEVRIWERGAGETLSSGTGSSAAAVAACLNGLTGRRVTVETPGGRLAVNWREDGEVVLTGDAAVVYRGEWLGGRDEG
jgi:diaminopimelate epimerase